MNDNTTKETTTEKCQECLGVGTVDLVCDLCGGSGQLDVVYSTIATTFNVEGNEIDQREEETEDEDDCYSCNASGTVVDVECGECGGSGIGDE